MRILLDALSRLPSVSVGTQALIVATMQIVMRHLECHEFVMLSGCPGVDKLFYGTSEIPVRLVKRPNTRLGMMSVLRSLARDADAVVSAWGDGYITTKPHRIFYKTACLSLGSAPAVLFPSSIGPFPKGVLRRALARKGLRHFDAVMARDTVTLQYLQELGIRDVHLVPDTAFLLDPAPAARIDQILSAEGLPTDREWIGLNASQLLNARYASLGTSYPALMSDIARHLHEISGLDVLFIPHQVYPPLAADMYPQLLTSIDGDDRHAIKQICQELGESSWAHAVMGAYDCHEYKGLISRSVIFVGGRMHSVIAAVSSCVPAITIQYSHKARGVMQTVGLREFVWDFRDSTEHLLQKIDTLWSARATLRAMLFDKMKELSQSAEGAGELLVQSMDGHN